MCDTLLAVGLVVGILGFSAVATHLFARAMYRTCLTCHTLNARRRSQCRNCGQSLKPESL